jgi:uroporphyrinogen-III synthase
MTTVYLASDADLRAATAALVAQPPDYFIATTGVGVRAWLETVETWGLLDELRLALGHARIVARGPKAAAALTGAGLDVWLKSPTEQMAALTELLVAEGLQRCRVAVQEYGMQSPELVSPLESAGASVTTIPVYRWRLPDDPTPARQLVEAVCLGAVDAVTFTSAPAVHNLFALAPERAGALRAAFNDDVVAACVGPVCAAGAVEEGIADPLAPSVGRLGLLVRVLGDRLSARRTTHRLNGHDVTVQGRALQIDEAEVDELAPAERAAWTALVRRPGAVVSADALLPIGEDPRPRTDLVEAAVGGLRRHLGPAAPALQSVGTEGYRLDLDLRDRHQG